MSYNEESVRIFVNEASMFSFKRIVARVEFLPNTVLRRDTYMLGMLADLVSSHLSKDELVEGVVEASIKYGTMSDAFEIEDM